MGSKLEIEVLKLNGDLITSNNAKGNLLVGDGSKHTVLAAGANGRFLVTDSAEATGLKYDRTPGARDYVYARAGTGVTIPTPGTPLITDWTNISLMDGWTYPGVSPNSFVCPTTGIYNIEYGANVNLDVSSVGGGTVKCNITINGVAPTDSDNEYNFPGGEQTISIYTNHLMASLTAGDEVQFRFVIIGAGLTFTTKALRAASRAIIQRMT